MDWNVIFATVVSNALFLTILGFVTQSIFAQLLSRNLARFESDLSRKNSEFQIRYSKLHETRAEVIANLYELLVDAETTNAALVSDYARTKKADINKEIFKEASEKWQKLGYYFSRKKIYFDEAFCRRMSELSIASISSDFLYLALESENNPNELEKPEKDFLEKARNEIPKIRQDMERDFRHLLGIQI